MEKNTSGCSHKFEILGIIFLAIATVLTLYTLNGMGILGMFIVGLVFCKHKHSNVCCPKCGCANCECCSDGMSSCGMSSCDMPKAEKMTAKKATTRKRAPKVAAPR